MVGPVTHLADQAAGASAIAHWTDDPLEAFDVAV
jgi:hypothetical protein